ncbi:MAG: methylenetetrahydrofolate reductase C-terminal domain-containing protein [Promethearchaeati archaeon SRVP18_Atabeyarchaeia-1]
MIITEQKKFEEVVEKLAPFKKVLVVGCGHCATVCQTGGEDQAKAMVSKLKESKGPTGMMVNMAVVEEPCDIRILKRDMKKAKKEFDEADAILAMACGVGSQTLATVVNKPVVPALNTLFLGQVERIGKFEEMCRACGNCILADTGGVCPITRCAKGLMNGPCGGMSKGKCEVNNYTKDCGWVLIYNRLKDQGRLDLFRQYRPPRDYALSGYPRSVDTRAT